MAEVKVTHPDLKSDDAKVPPKRELIPEGEYQAIIMQVAVGMTKADPPKQKISVEFQILFGVKTPEDETLRGRRVFQDYVLEHDPSNLEISALRRHDLRMLLDAAAIPFTDAGFNTDHLVNKPVKIMVRHRRGQPRSPEEPTPIFANVTKVDSAEEPDAEDLI